MTPQVKSLGLATMMNVVEKERNVPMMRTQLSSRLHARTTGVFQNFQSTPACTVHSCEYSENFKLYRMQWWS